MTQTKTLQILFVFGFPIRIGGHFKSALAMVKNLISMDHRIYIASPGGAEEMIQKFISAGALYYPIIELAKVHRFPNAGGAAKIRRICKQHSIDVIHAQDFNAIAVCYLTSIASGKKIVFTRAGGPAITTTIFPPPKINIIFFSQELIDGMTGLYSLKKENITLIRARIDMAVYKPREIREDFLNKYSLPSSGKKIAMAIRFNYAKMPWILNLMQFANKISSKKTGIKIIIAGEGPDFSTLSEQAMKINLQSSNGPIIHLIGPILLDEEICQLYNYADIVVGNGRGILEAMACRKPVIVLGEHGEAELVNAANIDEIAAFNFSGRHFRHTRGSSKTLAHILEELIESKGELMKASSFSYEYIKKYMDAAIGAQQLLDVYTEPLLEKNTYFDYFIWMIRVIYFSLKTSAKNKIDKIFFRRKFIPK